VAFPACWRYHIESGNCFQFINGKSDREKTTTTLPAPSPTIHTEVSTHYSGSDTESNSDSESSDGFEWLDKPEANVTGIESQKFNIGNLNIDTGSTFFLDFLSDQPQAASVANSAAPSNHKPVATTSSLVPDESECGKW
jgi:hypothetical protein